MIDVGDTHKFAQAFGKWLYVVNPDLGADKLKTVVQQFAMTAPIGGGDGEALSIDEFCTEALKGYALGEEASKL